MMIFLNVFYILLESHKNSLRCGSVKFTQTVRKPIVNNEVKEVNILSYFNVNP